MPAENIERIERPDKDTFFNEYVCRQRPVIIKNLYAGQPIGEIDTLEKARKAFGNVQLLVQQEYTAAASNKTKSFVTMTFDEYWKLVEKDPATQLCCTEYEIPARIMSLFKLPDLCRAHDANAAEILSMPRKYGDHDLLLNAFVANRGNKAHLHYDGDHRQVLLHQVFGRKEVILFPTTSGAHMKPLELGTNFSGCYLENMTREEKLELIERAGGYHATLYPGETVFIPMLMWHYLEYVDDAMGFNVRFGRTSQGRFLCADNFHRDHYIQNFASTLAPGRMSERRRSDAVARIVEEYTSKPPDIQERVKRMRTLFRALCAEICPEHRAHEYCPPEWESVELDRIVRDISKKVVYADPETVRRMRPTGPISSTQIRHIQEKAQQLEYPRGVLEHLLENRTGKLSVQALSGVEAAQFLPYLRSPGAAW